MQLKPTSMLEYGRIAAISTTILVFAWVKTALGHPPPPPFPPPPPPGPNPYVPNLDDCRLGNIYKIITDRHFALLALNPDDCKVHLIFSDESNPDRLNQLQLTSHNPHSRCADHPAVSLYTDDHGMLQPIYIAYNRTPEHGNLMVHFATMGPECQPWVRDPITFAYTAGCSFNFRAEHTNCDTQIASLPANEFFLLLRTCPTRAVDTLMKHRMVDMFLRVTDLPGRVPCAAIAFDPITQKMYCDSTTVHAVQAITLNSADFVELYKAMAALKFATKAQGIEPHMGGGFTVSEPYYISTRMDDFTAPSGPGRAIVGTVDGRGPQACIARFAESRGYSTFQLFVGPPINEIPSSPIFFQLRQQNGKPPPMTTTMCPWGQLGQLCP